MISGGSPVNALIRRTAAASLGIVIATLALAEREARA
jgi:hypothetical protein